MRAGSDPNIQHRILNLLLEQFPGSGGIHDERAEDFEARVGQERAQGLSSSIPPNTRSDANEAKFSNHSSFTLRGRPFLITPRVIGDVIEPASKQDIPTRRMFQVGSSVTLRVIACKDKVGEQYPPHNPFMLRVFREG